MVGWLYGACSEQLQLSIYSEFRLGYIVCIIGVIESFSVKSRLPELPDTVSPQRNHGPMSDTSCLDYSKALLAQLTANDLHD